MRTLLVVLLGLVQALASPSPAEVLARADAVQQAETAHMLIDQTITTTSGSTRTFRIESWSAGKGEKSLMRFLSPAPSAGIGMLTHEHGDNIWAYFPDSDDLRKIASSSRNSSMEGSDFSYEDMAGGGELGRKYEATGVVADELDGRACWRLSLVPSGSSPYARLEAWIDQETSITHRIHYFDRKDRHTKTLTMTDWRQVSGVWTPHTMVMQNLRRGSSTRIVVVQVAYGVPLDEGMFTTRQLTAI